MTGKRDIKDLSKKIQQFNVSMKRKKRAVEVRNGRTVKQRQLLPSTGKFFSSTENLMS